jgi:hypothetical protein
MKMRIWRTRMMLALGSVSIEATALTDEPCSCRAAGT